MGIIQNYREQGIPEANRLKFDPNDRPLVVKDIPMTIDSREPNSSQLIKRIDDLQRISKILTSGPGLKYLANESLLGSVNIKPNPARKKGLGKALSVASQGFLQVARVVGSTLAQVPVNGTGTHFVKAFRGKGKGTYLNDIGFSDVIPHASSNGSDIISSIFPPKNVLPDASGVASKADEALRESGGSIIFSASGSTLDTTASFDNNGIKAAAIVSSSAITDTNSTISDKDPDYFSNYDNSDKSITKEGPTGILRYEGGDGAGQIKNLPGDDKKNKNTKSIPYYRNQDGSLVEKYKPGKNINIISRIGIGSPGAPVLEDGVEVFEAGLAKNRQDVINLLGPQDSKLTGVEAKEGRDLVKFRFQIITPDKTSHLYFRAFIDSFSDGFTSNWNSYNYIGRGESFHTYGNFDRSIDLAFKVAAQSPAEMKPLYQKVNTLVSATTPTYNNNFMRGTLVKMTVGDYIYELPGFLNNVNLSWQTDYPWEIAMNRPEDLERDTTQQELPMVLDCSLSFTPIHDFLPTAENVVSGDVFKANRYITHGSDESNTIITNLFEDE